MNNIEKNWLSELNARIPEIRPVLDKASEEGFRSQFSDSPSVALIRVAYSIEDHPQRGLQFRADITLDYGTFLATAISRSKLRGICRDPDMSLAGDSLLQTISSHASAWMYNAFHALPRFCTLTREGRCSSKAFQSIAERKVKRSCGGRSFDRFLQDLAEEIRPSLEEKLLKDVREALVERQKSAFPSPAPWLCPSQVESCHLELSSSKTTLTVDCTVEVAYLGAHSEVSHKVGRDFFRDAVFLEEGPLRERLREEWRAMAFSAGQEIRDALVPFQVIPPEGDQADNGFPPDLWVFLRQGYLEAGLVSMELDLGKADPEKGEMFLGQTGPDEAVVVSLPLTAGHRSPPFHLGLQDSAAGVDILSGSFPPDSLAGTVRTLKAGAELYAQADFGDLAKPLLHVQISRDGLTQVAYGRRSIPVDEEGRRVLGERPGEWLEKLFERVRTYARESSREDEEIRRALGSLNPISLAMLQYTYREGAIGYWSPDGTLAASFSITKKSFWHYLEQTFQVTVPFDGKWQPLVRHHKPALPVLRQIILYARPGDFRPEDFPNLTPAGRLQALEAMARVAGSREARWKLLELLEKAVPRTTAVAFVKSEAGQTFLRGLEGDDREYSRLSLEDLPGCKRLIRSLLGSEQEGADADPASA